MVAVRHRDLEGAVEEVAAEEPQPREHQVLGEGVRVGERGDDARDEAHPAGTGHRSAGVDVELEVSEVPGELPSLLDVHTAVGGVVEAVEAREEAQEQDPSP